MNEHDLDAIIESSLKSEAEKIDLPPKEQIWEKIVQSKNLVVVNYPRRKWLVLGISTFTVVIIVLVVQLWNVDFHPKIQRPSQVQASNYKVFNNVEEARKEIPFDFQLLGSETNYKLNQILYQKLEKGYSEVKLTYLSGNVKLEILENNLPRDSVAFSTVQLPNSTIREVDLTRDKGALISTENGYKALAFYNKGLSITIQGVLSDEEIILLANSME